MKSCDLKTITELKINPVRAVQEHTTVPLKSKLPPSCEMHLVSREMHLVSNETRLISLEICLIFPETCLISRKRPSKNCKYCSKTSHSGEIGNVHVIDN